VGIDAAPLVNVENRSAGECDAHADDDVGQGRLVQALAVSARRNGAS
jgi:hypothetical protein